MIRTIFTKDYIGVVAKEIKLAEKSIWVAMFEWVWYPGQHTGSIQDVNRELCIRAKNKTDVRVILHNESMGRTLHKMNRKTAGHLKQSGAQIKWGNTGTPLHAKVWIFDEARVIIGSHNISVRASRTNVEVSVLCDVPDMADVMVKWFNELWDKGMQ